MANRMAPDGRYRPVPTNAGASPTYGGAYGRDGAPASRVVRPINPSYHPSSPASAPAASPRQQVREGYSASSPARPLFADRGSERERERERGGYARVGGGMPYVSANPSPPPPSYHSSDGGHGAPPLSAPIKAAFAEAPGSPGSMRKEEGGAGRTASVMWGADVSEKVANEFRGDEERADFWKRMSGDARRRQSTAWLNKQTGKNGRWKTFAWIAAIVVLVAVGGSLGYHFAKAPPTKEGQNAPTVPGWANGVSDVPTIFATPTGAAPTASSTHGSSSPDGGSRNKKKRHFGSAPH